jgi:DNA mismatch repair endonuclease MutH
VYSSTKDRGRREERSLVETLGLREGDPFESKVLDRLGKYRFRELGEIASQLKVQLGRGKSAAAILVRRAVGILDDESKIREFEQRGIRIKTVPISPQGQPWEAMSFPKFTHLEVIHEEWEDTDLLSHLTRLLIVPLIRETRRTPRERQKWGNAFFWSPSARELEGIHAEWEDYVRRIARGEADRLPGYSATKFIHVRPHARDGSDVEEAPVIGMVRKQSFWLNPGYVARIVQGHGGVAGLASPLSRN